MGILLTTDRKMAATVIGMDVQSFVGYWGALLKLKIGKEQAILHFIPTTASGLEAASPWKVVSTLEHPSRSLNLQLRKQNIHDTLQEILNELALVERLVVQSAQRHLTLPRPQVDFDLRSRHFHADPEILDLNHIAVITVEISIHNAYTAQHWFARWW